jgi:hypothetical protein
MKVIKSVVMLLALVLPLTAEDYDEEPIRYSASPVDDPVARLARRIDAGEVRLQWDDDHGWLPSLLAQLHIPHSSQTLVFSKTSLQREHIGPSHPRALYFNDEVYVGTVQHGGVLEIASTDPRQGTVFYILPQSRQGAASLQRQTHECLQCHDSNGFTGGVPGLVMRSVYPASDGRPILTAGSHVTDPRSPFRRRWGGWYVTGIHEGLEHLGNRLFPESVTPEAAERSPTVARTTLAGLVDTTPYLTPHSDVIALMVLGHQVQMHNLLTRASYEARRALRDDAVMNQALGRPADFRSDTCRRRLGGAAEALLRCLLFSDEAPLRGPVRGTSAFASEFQAHGPRDPQGRSLRDLDLSTRLLRHPCSHLIHGEAFDALPQAIRSLLLERLLQVLTGSGPQEGFQHLTAVDRRAILEILVATMPSLPPAFAAAVAGASIAP